MCMNVVSDIQDEVEEIVNSSINNIMRAILDNTYSEPKIPQNIIDIQLLQKWISEVIDTIEYVKRTINIVKRNIARMNDMREPWGIGNQYNGLYQASKQLKLLMNLKRFLINSKNKLIYSEAYEKEKRVLTEDHYKAIGYFKRMMDKYNHHLFSELDNQLSYTPDAGYFYDE